jgi:hypothetical protein
MAARNIKLRGAEWEPRHPSWRRATKDERERVWRKIGEFAQAAYRAQLLRGEGADGGKLAAVKPASRPDHATGPPLDPHYGASRTYSLVAIHSTDHGCTLFWRADRGSSWSTILGYHAEGLVRGAPVRDVLDLSPRAARETKVRTETYWRTVKGKEPEGKPRPKPRPLPKPKPRPPIIPTPAPVPAPAARTPLEEAIRVAAEHGIELETKGNAHLVEVFGEFQGNRVYASYSSAHKKIYINEKHPSWSDLNAARIESERLRAIGWFSSGDPHATIHHEVGHALHHRDVGMDEFRRLSKGFFNATTKDHIGKVVSEYASTDPLEFVAEVYAGIKTGRVYPDDIMEFYAKLKGPKP